MKNYLVQMKNIGRMRFSFSSNRNEVKIVCACHGTHMTPEEFTRHTSMDATGQENNATMSVFPVGNSVLAQN